MGEIKMRQKVEKNLMVNKQIMKIFFLVCNIHSPLIPIKENECESGLTKLFQEKLYKFQKRVF